MFARSASTIAFVCAYLATRGHSFAPSPRIATKRNHNVLGALYECNNDGVNIGLSRKSAIEKTTAALSGVFLASLFSTAQPAWAKCTDIEPCREEGERRVEADLKRNPIVKLSDGVRYRVLSPPASPNTEKVKDSSNIDLAYSISTASGQYMYSKGFGFEKVDFGGRMESDLGLDSMRLVIGQHNVPVGIEYALIGAGKGEKRRVELPPGVGFETSNWSPEPTTRMGKAGIEQYKRKLSGFGSQPPFPAETVWDIEVLAVRN